MTYRLQSIPAAAIAMLIAYPAGAQSARAEPEATNLPAAANEQPGEILVTARRRSENIAKVPISITAIGGDQLREKQISSEADLQSAVPGLTIRQNGSANQFNFALRGQSVDTYSGSPPGVLAYINEVQIVQHSASTFYDLEGIQVLKGPQGTLFGRNSTGGAVLFQTARPADTPSGYVIGRYGNYESRYLEAALSLPLGDKAGLRVAGNYTGGGAHVTNLLTGKRLGRKNNKSVRGTLVLEPVDGLTNTTVVQHSWEGGNGIPSELYSAYACGAPGLNSSADCLYGPSNPAFVAFINARPKLAPYAGGVAAFAALQRQLGPWKAATEVPLFHKAKSTFAINTTSYELSPDLTLKNIFGYNKSTADDGYDYDGSPYPIFTTAGVLSPDGTTMFDQGTGYHPTTRQLSEEFQIQGKAFDNRLVFVIGGYFLDQTYDITSTLHGFDGIFPPTNFVYQVRQTDHSRALFAQGTYKVTDQFSLTGGFRYSWAKQSQRQGPLDAYRLAGVGVTSERIKASKPSWTVSLDYQATPSLLLYATSRGSWRTGGFNYSTPPFPTTAANGGNIFKPETTRDVELGIKYSGDDLGVPTTFNIAAYQQWVKNVQRAAYVPGFAGPGLVTVNVPKARIRGFETDMSVRPASWLTFGAALAYTDARYTSNVVSLLNPLTQVSFDTQYGPFADTPKWTGSAYFEASHALPDDAGELVLHGDIFAQSSFGFSNVGDTLAPGTTIDGYALINARLSWRNIAGSNLTAAFHVRNLTNRKYYTGGNSTGPTLGTNTSVGGLPRMFGGELRFDF